MGKIVYITSQSPCGKSEVWAIGEMLALVDAGVDLVVIPRTGSGTVFHSAARSLLPRTLKVPFASTAIFKALIVTLLNRPILLASIIYWIWQQSNKWSDLLKGIIVLPKSLFLAERLRGQDVSHIHAHSTTSVAVVACILARFLHVPWSFTLHSSSSIHKGYHRSLDAHMNSANFVRCISKVIAARLLEFMGDTYAPKIKVVHLGVPCLGTLPRRSCGKEDFLIGTPGWLLPHKGHQFALKASRLLLDQGVSNFTWYFYGEGHCRTTLTFQIKDMGLQNVIRLAGMVDNTELLQLYRQGKIDILVLPSVEVNGIHEGIPVSLMEAMAHGVPVIATDCGGTLELIEDGAGIAVPQGDERAIATAMLKLMRDKEFYYAQAQRGLSKVYEEFDISKTAQQLGNMYLS